jgi:hypothetical protein
VLREQVADELELLTGHRSLCRRMGAARSASIGLLVIGSAAVFVARAG